MTMGDYTKFSLESLTQLDDNRIAVAVNQYLKVAAMDCEDRPGDKKVRKVTLEVMLKPVTTDDGLCEDVTVEFGIKQSIPTAKSKPYSMKLNKNGVVAFRNGSEDNHHQSNFLPADE